MKAGGCKKAENASFVFVGIPKNGYMSHYA